MKRPMEYLNRMDMDPVMKNQMMGQLMDPPNKEGLEKVTSALKDLKDGKLEHATVTPFPNFDVKHS